MFVIVDCEETVFMALHLVALFECWIMYVWGNYHKYVIKLL